jgi:hypothetical protein
MSTAFAGFLASLMRSGGYRSLHPYLAEEMPHRGGATSRRAL